MPDRQNLWRDFLSEYANADAEYQAAREAAARHSLTVDVLTAAFLAEERARDKVVSLRQRLYCNSAPAASASAPAPIGAVGARQS
jgi:hypothetical protein